MDLYQRIESVLALGNYLKQNTIEWQDAKKLASIKNGWFTIANIELAVNNIIDCFLQKDLLEKFVTTYIIKATNTNVKNVGLVTAGNIPLVGFHDLLCIILCGHNTYIKVSTKDDVLINFIITWLHNYNTYFKTSIVVAEQLKGMDAYIATGSNNSARYFEYYFSKYPCIIRRNRTSVAILDGTESPAELTQLADDVCQYFGLGCRNVTHIYVPKNYNFEQLIPAFAKYIPLADHNKYKNNYDYNLAIYLLNNQYYMTNGQILLVENKEHFSPISCLHYSFYNNINDLEMELQNNADIQCIVGKNNIAFGQAQQPSIMDFADGADTMAFLSKL